MGRCCDCCDCCICDSLEDASDSDLLEEIRARKLNLPKPREELMRDILHDLMAKQYRRASVGMNDLINSLLGDNLRDAVAAIRDQRWDDAICRLDGELYPSEAATATRLPPKPPKPPAQYAAEIASNF